MADSVITSGAPITALTRELFTVKVFGEVTISAGDQAVIVVDTLDLKIHTWYFPSLICEAVVPTTIGPYTLQGLGDQGDYPGIFGILTFTREPAGVASTIVRLLIQNHTAFSQTVMYKVLRIRGLF